MTSWTRSRAASLASSRATWALAVATLIDSSVAISRLDMPRPTSVSTSCSRPVTPLSRRLGGAVAGGLAVGWLAKRAVIASYRRIGVLKSVGFTSAQVAATYLAQIGLPGAWGATAKTTIALRAE
jgi:hypothetical protein